MITYKQLTLAEIFEDCQNKFDNDKYQFLSLLDEAINLDEIVPVYTERCIVKLDKKDKEAKKIERWQKISESAAKYADWIKKKLDENKI